MFDTSQLFGGTSAAGAFYPKTIDQSLRFEDGDSAYLSKTLTSGTDRTTWTFSAWVKRGNISTATNQYLLNADTGTTDAAQTQIFFKFTDDTLRISGGATLFRETSMVFRDPSAWYHIVVVWDTGNATANDRIRLYVNGERITDFSTSNNPAQNDDGRINSGVEHRIGARLNNSSYFDGYMAEVHFVGDTAYDADDFGELKSGIWVAKTPSVTYGTNGFYLDFADSAAIGDDESGNTNDWTVNNLVASDVVPDSPTNNFATLSPLAKTVIGTASILAEGNLSHQSNALEYRSGASTFLIPTNSGKWYWEVYARSGGIKAGVIEGNPLRLFYSAGYYIGYHANEYSKFNQYKVNNASFSTLWGTAATAGDVVGFLFDSDNGDLYTYLNGTIEESGTAMFSGLTSSEGYIPAVSDYSSITMVNFGQDSTFAGNLTAGGNSDANGIGDFKYTVPTDAKALCTVNLPDPVIDPAQDATPEDHFNVALYTGASALTVDTGLPSVDMVWIKSRSAAYLPRIFDSIRGDDTAIYTAVAVAEGSYSVNDDCELNTPTDGNLYFDVTNAGTNGSGVSTVAWAWKAGGTGVSNTDGSITSTVSANPDAGFSIVSYTGTGSAATVGHGLSSAPEMVICKSRTNADGWSVYHKGVASDAETDYLWLNLNDAAVDNSAFWNDTAPTSSVFSVGTHVSANRSGANIIAYCFHSVDGFSKVGSYTGNGSATNGTFVYTGFRPKWIMVKRSDSGVATADWYIWDAERNTFNVAGKTVQANESTAESDSGNHDLDILSNGFKLRIDYATVNGSGNNFIYLAFAEQPFKYSNAR